MVKQSAKSDVIGNESTFRGEDATLQKLFLSTFEQGPTFKGKNLLPLGANSLF